MTNNQTIDGVQREKIERALGAVEQVGLQDKFIDYTFVRTVKQELRDLLDAPAHPCPVQLDGCDGSCAPAAQPHGEPVGFRYRAHGGPWELMDESPFADGRTHHRQNGEELQPLYVEQPAPFQSRVKPWMLECFGEVIAADTQERNHRFLEEALELVQANSCTADEAHELVDYVYGRPVGEPVQEVGGVMVTLAALCLASGLDMHHAAETELARIWTKVEQIRAKQAAKPAMSPLPGAYPGREQPAPVATPLDYGSLDAVQRLAVCRGDVVAPKSKCPTCQDDALFGCDTCMPDLEAVVLPERREPTQENPHLSDADHEWNACIDEVARLNPSL